MIPADRGDGDLAAIAAALLDQGGRADGLSRLITTAALIALMVSPALPGRPPVLVQAILGVVALAGLGESYLASRVGFDVALFRRLADRRDAFDLDRLDSALLGSGRGTSSSSRRRLVGVPSPRASLAPAACSSGRDGCLDYRWR